MGMMSLVFAALLAAPGAPTCAMSTGYTSFDIGRDAQPQQADDGILEAPKAEVISVTRGVGGAPGSCDASGILVVGLKPRGGSYKASELGFEFKVLGDDTGNAAFLDRIVAISPDNSRNELLLLWPDVAPGQQKPLRFDIEVRAVTRGNLRGPAAVLHIDTRDPAVIAEERKQQEELERARAKLAKEQEKERKRLAKEAEGN